METDICEWNLDKKLSDHKGNLLELKNDSENKKSKINNCLLLFIGFCAFNLAMKEVVVELNDRSFDL